MRALACVMLLSSATALAASEPSSHPGARPGEAFTFKFSLGPVEGGRARMSIGRPVTQRGRKLIAVHGEAETTSIIKLVARMNDDYKLVFDAHNLLPVQVAETERGLRERRVISTVDGRTADVDFWSPEKQHKARHGFPRIVRDPLSSFFALRALPLDDAKKIDLDVLDGAALWRVALTVHRGQALRLENSAQAQPAIRIDGVARRLEDNGRPRVTVAPRNLTVWISDDGNRVLLRMECDTDLGRASLELTSYVPPATHVADERSPDLPGIELR